MGCIVCVSVRIDCSTINCPLHFDQVQTAGHNKNSSCHANTDGGNFTVLHPIDEYYH